MSMHRLAELLLRLYPGDFRERFRDEWHQLAQWHLRGATPGAALRLRVAALLILDTLRTLPAAWGGSLGRRLRGGGPWAQDLRHALRGLRRNRAFTGAAVLCVALGVGADTAVFSVANAVLLRPLPYDDPGRLVIVWNRFPGTGMARLPLSGVQVAALREEEAVFEGVEGIWATAATLESGQGETIQVGEGAITPGFFELLGVAPALGRSFLREHPEGPVPAGVLVSDELWRGALGADPAAVGRTLHVGGRAVEVLGVLPPGFTLHFPEDGGIPPRLDVFTPLPWDPAHLPPAQHFLRVVARLRPGTDLDTAGTAAEAAAGRARDAYPELAATGDRISVHPLHADAVQAARPVLVALLGGVSLFLLLACANVASLVLARTLGRSRELAIRASIGAPRRALARLVVMESLLVTAAGALLGLALGAGASRALWALRPDGLARADVVSLDGRVLAFTAAVSLGTALIVAVSALAALEREGAARRLRGVRRHGSGNGRRFRELATATEVAVGLVLVTGSALMVQSLASLGRESVGFEPGEALTFRLSLDLGRFPSDEERARLARELEGRLAGLPGVEAAGASSHLPFAAWANWAEAAPPEGTPAGERSAWFADLRAVTPAFLEAVGATLVAGRFFEPHDDLGSAPVVIIDETMARRLFPDGDAVGRRLEPSRFLGGEFVPTPAVVVGVIRDVRDRSPSRPSDGQVFWPFSQSPRWELTWFLRTDHPSEALVDAVRREVRAVSPDLAVAQAQPMAAYVERATATTRYLALVGSTFSALALIMASLGLYGVVAYVTVQRTSELGVRMVLGASGQELLREVLGHGVRVGLAGVAIGTAASIALAGFLRGLVYGVSPYDPLTLLAVAVLLLAVSLVASLAPARRATRVDPLAALRGAVP